VLIGPASTYPHATSRFRLTVPKPPAYIFPMSEPRNTHIMDTELRRLETRIDELVATVHRLKEENRALRQRQEVIAADRTALLSRNDQVRTRVEAIIGRLRAMEHGA
jgi:cell division protein ZapB